MNRSERVWRETGLRSAVLAGDEQAWETLYQEAYDRLAAFVAWRCAGLRQDSEEILQETWLTAVRRIRTFDPKQGCFASWLHGIAANLLRNHFRRQANRPGSAAETLRNGRAAAAPSPDAILESRERAIQMARALAELPEHYEAVLCAKYVEQQSVAQIAEAWQQTPKAVESLLTRARQALREAYLRMEPTAND
jgi:RNA polymerase sigma-70 factor (ECF subfamily)